MKLLNSFSMRSIDRSFRGVPALLLFSNCLNSAWLKSSSGAWAGAGGLSRELQPGRRALGFTEPVRWCERMNWLLQALSSPPARLSSLALGWRGRRGRASQWRGRVSQFSPLLLRMISCLVRRWVISSSRRRFCMRSSLITLSFASKDSRSVYKSFAITMQLQRSRFSWYSRSGVLADSQETLWTVYLLLGSPKVSLLRFRRSIFLKSSRTRYQDCSDCPLPSRSLSLSLSATLSLSTTRSLSFSGGLSGALSAVFLPRELSSSCVLVLMCLLWLRSLMQSSRNSMNWLPSSRYFCKLVETDSRKQPSIDTTRFFGYSQGSEWYILLSGIRVNACLCSPFCEVVSPPRSSCPSPPFRMRWAQSSSTSSAS